MDGLADISTFTSIMHGTSVPVHNGTFQRIGRFLESKPGRWLMGALTVPLAIGTGVRAHNMWSNRPRNFDTMQVNVANPLVDEMGIAANNYPEELANISRTIATPTYKLGKAYANKYIFDDGKDLVNNINYQTAMNRYRELMPELKRRGIDVSGNNNILEGFDLFGRFCANINIDLTDEINSVKLSIGKKHDRGTFDADQNEIKIHPEAHASTVAHELFHSIEANNAIVGEVMRVKPLIPKGFMEKGGGVKQNSILRGLISGEPYAGIFSNGWGEKYRAGGSNKLTRGIEELVQKTRELVDGGAFTKDDLYRIAKEKFPGTDDATIRAEISAAMRKVAAAEYEGAMMSRGAGLVENGPDDYYNDEYLPTFISVYKELEGVPLLYAMDARRKLDLINKKAEMLGVAYSRGDETLQNKLTKAAKQMLIKGIENKIPSTILLKTVAKKINEAATGYVDKKAIKFYKKTKK